MLSSPKGKGDKLGLFTTTLHKGTITDWDSRSDISIDGADVISWATTKTKTTTATLRIVVSKSFFFFPRRCSPRHVRIFYFKSVAAALYRLDEGRWIYKEKRRRVFRTNLFAVQTINDGEGFPWSEVTLYRIPDNTTITTTLIERNAADLSLYRKLGNTIRNRHELLSLKYKIPRRI